MTVHCKTALLADQQVPPVLARLPWRQRKEAADPSDGLPSSRAFRFEFPSAVKIYKRQYRTICNVDCARPAALPAERGLMMRANTAGVMARLALLTLLALRANAECASIAPVPGADQVSLSRGRGATAGNGLMRAWPTDVTTQPRRARAQSPSDPSSYGLCTSAVDARIAAGSNWCHSPGFNSWPSAPAGDAVACLKFGRMTVYRGPVRRADAADGLGVRGGIVRQQAGSNAPLVWPVWPEAACMAARGGCSSASLCKHPCPCRP